MLMSCPPCNLLLLDGKESALSDAFIPGNIRWGRSLSLSAHYIIVSWSVSAFFMALPFPSQTSIPHDGSITEKSIGCFQCL